VGLVAAQEKLSDRRQFRLVGIVQDRSAIHPRLLKSIPKIHPLA
jgi:hypothetical protein